MCVSGWPTALLASLGVYVAVDLPLECAFVCVAVDLPLVLCAQAGSCRVFRVGAAYTWLSLHNGRFYVAQVDAQAVCLFGP